MAIQFKKYESTATDLEIVGTVSSVIGKGGTLKFVPNTFTSGKRLAIILLNKKGESTVLPCSTRVTNVTKDAKNKGASKKQMLAAISRLEVSEDEDGRNFIIAPRGSGGEEESFVIEDLTKETVSYDDLMDTVAW
jgi:hypothetical protein